MRKVTIIGAGPGNPDLLSRAALDAIDIADVVIGAHRALVGIDVPPDVVRCELVKTADIVAALTDAASWQRAVVVMTGDVGLFSGARRLVEALSGDVHVHLRVAFELLHPQHRVAAAANQHPHPRRDLHFLLLVGDNHFDFAGHNDDHSFQFLSAV